MLLMCLSAASLDKLGIDAGFNVCNENWRFVNIARPIGHSKYSGRILGSKSSGKEPSNTAAMMKCSIRATGRARASPFLRRFSIPIKNRTENALRRVARSIARSFCPENGMRVLIEEAWIANTNVGIIVKINKSVGSAIR